MILQCQYGKQLTAHFVTRQAETQDGDNGAVINGARVATDKGMNG